MLLYTANAGRIGSSGFLIISTGSSTVGTGGPIFIGTGLVFSGNRLDVIIILLKYFEVVFLQLFFNL